MAFLNNAGVPSLFQITRAHTHKFKETASLCNQRAGSRAKPDIGIGSVLRCGFSGFYNQRDHFCLYIITSYSSPHQKRRKYTKSAKRETGLSLAIPSLLACLIIERLIELHLIPNTLRAECRMRLSPSKLQINSSGSDFKFASA